MYGTCPLTDRRASTGILDDRVIDEMSAAEESHWWYWGLRDLLTQLARSARWNLKRGGVVLDIGCGAGANLRLLHELLAPRHLEGFDAHPHSVQLASRKCVQADVHLGDVREPPLHHDQYDLMLCCDVISLVGRTACRGGLVRLVEHLAPGGLFVLHVPACPWLFANHDTAVGNIERYRRDEIEWLVRSLGLKIELATYRMSLLFPLIAACRRFERRRADDVPRSDLGRGSRRLAPLMRRIVAWENRATIAGRRWPIGSSVFVVARR